ncbi:MAG TPA: substrate-binding domain-containing protein, partial [Ktedonobacteraceae bacterium]|nr:substrate-binding domain-containing protein [Ktedonobacteraceae bacterium]
WSSDPVQWSPIGEEQSGSVPLTAADYLQHMPLVPEEPTPQAQKDASREQDALVAVEPQPEALPVADPGAEVKDLGKASGKRKKLLPILVIVLLLIGLLGALLSSFLFTNPSGGPSSLRPGGTTAQVGTTVIATPGITPKASATVRPASGAPTATAAVSPTPVAKPSPSPTPVPIPTNPAMPSFACSSGAMNMDGSSSFVPIIQQLTNDYNNQCSNSVSFNYNADDSQTGLNNLQRGSISIAYTDLPSSGRAGLVDYRVAALIFAVVVNTDTQVTNLTTSQLQAIYTGRVTNWSQVGGSNEAIVVVTQPAGSTLRDIFETYVLHGTTQTVVGDTSGAGVQNISGGIAYMPLVDVAASASGAQSVALNGVAPSVSSVASGSYPFWSIEHLYTNHAAQGVALSFVSFCLNTLSIYDYTSNGAVPYGNMSDVALRSHLQDPSI